MGVYTKYVPEDDHLIQYCLAPEPPPPPPPAGGSYRPIDNGRGRQALETRNHLNILQQRPLKESVKGLIKSSQYKISWAVRELHEVVIQGKTCLDCIHGGGASIDVPTPGVHPP